METFVRCRTCVSSGCSTSYSSANAKRPYSGQRRHGAFQGTELVQDSRAAISHTRRSASTRLKVHCDAGRTPEPVNGARGDQHSPVLASEQTSPPVKKLTRQRSWPPRKAELYVLRSDGLSCSRETIQDQGCLTWQATSTQQELLVWKSKPRCVLVLKKLDSSLDSAMDEVIGYLGSEEGLTVVVEAHEYRRLAEARPEWMPFLESFDAEERLTLHQVTDFVVCLGGDGVILHACTLFHRSQVPPIIGFNLGSMGFLTNHEFASYRKDLRGVVYGRKRLDTCQVEGGRGGVHVTLRMRLLCEIYRRGCSEPIETEVFEVLNEVCLDRGSSPFLSKIECWDRGRLVTRVQADGVLLATPTGSTAYSVAAGGSMVHPTLPAILFTPICPHSLSFRPVILPDYADLELVVPDDARSTAWVCFDGKFRQELLHGDRVRVRMSPNPVPTINRADQTTDWFGSLQRCFGWSERIEQKPLDSTADLDDAHLPVPPACALQRHTVNCTDSNQDKSGRSNASGGNAKSSNGSGSNANGGAGNSANNVVNRNTASRSNGATAGGGAVVGGPMQVGATFNGKSSSNGVSGSSNGVSSSSNGMSSSSNGTSSSNGKAGATGSASTTSSMVSAAATNGIHASSSGNGEAEVGGGVDC